MSYVFISYAREDQPLAKALADDLKGRGYNVWWDTEELLGSDDFYEAILAALSNAKAAIVIWTKTSTSSRFVRDEARFALHQGKLVATKVPELNVNEIPFGFQGQHTGEVGNRDQIVRAIHKLGVRPAAVSISGVSQQGEVRQQDKTEAAAAWERIQGTHDTDELLAFIDQYPTSVFRTTAVQRVRTLLQEGAAIPQRGTSSLRMSNVAAFFSGLTFRIPSFQLSTQAVFSSIGSSLGYAIASVFGVFTIAGISNYIKNSLGWSLITEGILAALLILLLSLAAWLRFHKWLKQRNFPAAIVMAITSIALTIAIVMPLTDVWHTSDLDVLGVAVGLLAALYACWQMWRAR